MKIAVFGGSFNPLHLGHAMLADTVIKELGFDKVLFVPAYMPPHKIINTGNKTTSSDAAEKELQFVAEKSAADRIGMLKAFCESEGDGHFEVESCEIERGGISYTCDTVEYLSRKYGKELSGKLHFIMGDEVAADFHKWKNPEKIAEYADFIITHRYPDINAIEKLIGNAVSSQDNIPTGTYKRDFEVRFDKEKFGYPFIYLENPMLPVSSTEIRRRVAEGKSYKYLVPAAVFDYINNHNLYKN